MASSSSSSPTNSEPILIDHSIADTSDHSNAAAPDSTPERPPPPTRASTSALEKCWICLSTREEDPPSPPNPPTAWRTPCSCSLQAHEACLLDWIADQEAPRTRAEGRSRRSPEKILCPQCRSEIRLERPVDLLVKLCRRIDRTYSSLVTLGLAGTISGTILSGFYVHGRLAVHLVFGPEASALIHRSSLIHPPRALAYCFIPLSLIFSRSSNYADYVLPVGTLTLLGFQIENGYIDSTVWPPLPSTVFAALPLVRQFYFWSYDRLFSELNRRWIKDVQPRREEGYEGQEGNIADIMNEHEAELAGAEADGGGGMVFELEVNLGAVEEPEEFADQGEAAAPAQEAQQNANFNENGNNNGGGHVHRLLGDNELMDEGSTIGQNLLGALLLPAAASIAGDALKLVLPSSWTNPLTNFYRGRTGLLGTKWGRSVVGGMAFVVVKDMLVLYCRWRLAEAHKMRRIMNFDKLKKHYVSVPAGQ